MPAPPPPIRILAPAKESGDLFGRLVSDLFLALGYDQPRLNVHKAGREIDVSAKHRTEPRWVVAECKATAKPIGGDDINKFVGALQAERRKFEPKEEVTGYFLSLSGFTETALEQERDFGEPPRLALLNGRRIVEELVRGRIVVSPERALERAGRSAAREGAGLVPEDRPQLLAHEIGWVWAVRFRRNVEPTHVALVHADGELLSPALAREVLAADRVVRGNLHRLTCLAPETQDQEDAKRLAEARHAYFNYLAAECGEIELEGLPADQEVGSRRLRLENLFVPLHLASIPQEMGEEKQPTRLDGSASLAAASVRLSVGESLAKKARLAILAAPGGGKTTLLKRLAVSYAFPERRTDLGDRLPDREWFPVLLRCRQIEDRATEPVISLLASLGERAEMGENASAFRGLLLESLREGRVLLLVDGLDEIADSPKRVAFVTQLRTFLSTYPGVDVVVTSREAGFRIVAGSLSAHCDHYRISDFDRSDMERLTVAWHREVVGDRPDVESQARSLAVTIWETDRVRRLAVNPLLLTTLLLVRRWVGQLPNRRSVLYEKAIEVLLWTWNVQGFEPLDVQEIIPQLAFLAWRMMEDEVHRISQPRLREVLQSARRQMPEVLAYARLSVSEFIERVERRSGLLVLSGHEVEDGRLVPLYEFRHLTFQEYLAAKAVVEGYYSDRKEEDTLLAKLEPNLRQVTWREVIPLAAVLAGRKVIPLVEFMVDRVSHFAGSNLISISEEDRGVVILLCQCLLDEVKISPVLAERAIVAICRVYPYGGFDSINQLAGRADGDMLCEVVWKGFSTSTANLDARSQSLRLAEHQRWGWPLDPELSEDRLRKLVALLRSGVERDRAVALLSLGSFRYPVRAQVPSWDFETTGVISYAIAAMLSSVPWEQFVGMKALVGIARAGGLSGDTLLIVLRRLFDLWLRSGSLDIRSLAAWTLVEMPLVSRTERPLHDIQETEARRVLSFLHEPPVHENSRISIAALIAAYYARLCGDDELIVRAMKISGFTRYVVGRERLHNLMEQLGDPGPAALRLFNQTCFNRSNGTLRKTR